MSDVLDGPAVTSRRDPLPAAGPTLHPERIPLRAPVGELLPTPVYGDAMGAPDPSLDDDVLDALAVLLGVIEDLSHVDRIRTRAEIVTRWRSEGASYTEIIDRADRPLIVEVLSERIEALNHASVRFRRAQAQALRNEGMTMEEIARRFGVTRQRVSALLHANGTRGGTAR